MMATKISFLHVLLAISFFITPLSTGRNAPMIDTTPGFQSSPCMFKIPEGSLEGVDIVCGYVTVPEQYENPTGPIIQIAVAIIKSKALTTKPDPLFMAQGGPGGSTIDAYAERLLASSRLRADRDIVLFDQRGTLYSRPALMCTEIDQLTIDTIEKDLSDDEYNRLNQAALQSCRQRLDDKGINLSSFDSIENAYDIKSIQIALGYQEINLYGVSYGTLLALHTMRLQPGILRSVIIDAVVPPDINFILTSAETMDRSFSELFNACKEDLSCNTDFPELEKVFLNLVDQLNQQPARIPMTDPDTGITYQALVDGDTFMYGLFQMLYVGSIIPALPRMIYQAKDENYDFFARIMAQIIFDRTMSYGMYYSVICAEDADFDPSERNLSALRPQIARAEDGDLEQLLESCRLWNVDILDSSVDDPVTSDIPTLVLSGNFDPITPPSFGDHVARSLSNSQVIVFPAGGHGQAFEGECEDSIILAFLDNPYAKVDTTCVQQQRPQFYTSSNTIEIPSLLSLLNLEGSSGVEFIVLVASMLFLLSATVAIPMIWLIAYLRRRKQKRPVEFSPIGTTPEYTPTQSLDPTPSLPHPESASTSTSVYSRLVLSASGWLAVLSGWLLFAFIIGLIITISVMVSANDNRLFFGVSASAWPLFLLPLFFTFLSGVMVLGFILSWLKGAWTIWTRLYFTFITLTSLISVAILFNWGMLTALF